MKVQSHWKTWGQRSQVEELFQKWWLLPGSFLFEDEDALGWFSQMLMNKWITQDFSFSVSGDGVCDSTFLQAPRWCWWHQSGYHRSYVWHSPSYWGSFSKEQLKLKNLATSSHNTTSFWFRASLSSHRTLGRIHGVSGREHIMGKIKEFLDPSGLSSPQLEIKMIMSLTCKVPIFYIIVIFNNNYLVIIQITPFLWEIQWALLTLIV